MITQVLEYKRTGWWRWTLINGEPRLCQRLHPQPPPPAIGGTA